MSTDRERVEARIEEALMRHADDLKTEPGAWNGIETGIRRSQRIRVAVYGGLALTAAVAAVVAVPKIVGDERRPFVGPGPTASPSPTSSPTTGTGVPAGWSVIRHDEQGFWFALPGGWRTGVFEGHAEFRPAGYPGLPVGEDTFAVETFVNFGEVAPPSGTATEVDINGLAAKRWETSERGGSHSVVYEMDIGCTPYFATPGRCDTPRLRVHVFASTPELWNEFGETGETMVRLLHASDRPMPAGSTSYRTLHGSGTVAWDSKTAVVAQFMEARMFGDVDRAKRYLTQNAIDLYESHDGGLDLYDPSSSRRMVSYRIVGREGADANSDEFTVEIVETNSDGSGNESTYRETLGVGPSELRPEQEGLDAVIRFAVRTNG